MSHELPVFGWCCTMPNEKKPTKPSESLSSSSNLTFSKFPPKKEKEIGCNLEKNSLHVEPKVCNRQNSQNHFLNNIHFFVKVKLQPSLAFKTFLTVQSEKIPGFAG